MWDAEWAKGEGKGEKGDVPCHHEGGEIRHLQVVLDVDGGVDDEAGEGEEEAECDKGESEAGVIACEGED